MSRLYIVLGSQSDWTNHVEKSKMTDTLDNLGIRWEIWVISAHRNPDDLIRAVRKRMTNHLPDVYIAIAGMAAALPGAIAAAGMRLCPVIGVALPSPEFPNGGDALLSMCRMPPGVPVATAGIGLPGLRNAALLAAQILSLGNPGLHARLEEFMRKETPMSIVPLKTSSTDSRQTEFEETK